MSNKYVFYHFQNVRKEVRSALDSLISGNKAKQLQTTKDVSKYYFKKIFVKISRSQKNQMNEFVFLS